MADDLDITVDDLDLDLRDLVVPKSRGRTPTQFSHVYSRDITESDILILQANPVRDVETPSIMKLKSSHHNLARLLAEGRTGVEASYITGYSQSRISILKSDPAFMELVVYYAGQAEEVFINVHERLANLGLDALEALHEKLLDPEGPDLSIKELKDIVELTMDRAGFGPKSTKVNEYRFSMDGLLNAVKDEVRTRQNGSIKTLDARPNRADPPGDKSPGLGLDIIDQADEHPTEPGSGQQSGRAEVREARREEAPGGEVSSPANENNLGGGS